MTKTIIKEQQELTEFGYMARAREVVTESCKCSYLQQELQKTREWLEKCEDALKHYANRMGMGGTARQYFVEKQDKENGSSNESN